VALEEHHVHSDVIEYDTFTADIDLQTVWEGGARRIEVVTAGTGTLVVEVVGDGGGVVSRTLTTIPDGWSAPLNVTKIKAATDVDLLRVYR
jgi:hypothetical protein